MNKLNKQKNNQEGFALLYSVLVAVLVVAVGASVVSLAIKQVVLTGTARESEYAFYAANTGLECARYWDTKIFTGNKKAFPGEGESEVGFDDYDAMLCGTDVSDSNKIKSMVINRGQLATDPDRLYTMPFFWTEGKHTFSFKLDNNIPLATPTCVEVMVETITNPEYTLGNSIFEHLVTITSQGMNTCDINSPRAVQRGLVLQYTR